jgi:uncharacterized protein YeaO (DUF488 family)
MVTLKRAYEPAAAADGKRVLVDRLWPRGVSKIAAKIDYWAKDLAPSTELRKWFAHDPKKWEEFQRRYAAELENHGNAVRELADASAVSTVTLVYGARDEVHNDAVVLKRFIENMH